MEKHSSYLIKRSSILFLQAAIVLIGIVVLVLMFLAPNLEGRNTQASLFQVYFNDPFLAYTYIGSVPFFVALFHAFKLLGYIGEDKLFTQAAVTTLKTIKYCAFITAGVILAADVYLRVVAHSGKDDPAGAIMLGIIATFISVVVGAAVAIFEKTLQRVVGMKS